MLSGEPARVVAVTAAGAGDTGGISRVGSPGVKISAGPDATGTPGVPASGPELAVFSLEGAVGPVPESSGVAAGTPVKPPSVIAGAAAPPPASGLCGLVEACTVTV